MPRPFSEEKKQKWKERILQQRESGLSVARWCRKNDVSPRNFSYWRNKLFPKAGLDRSAFTEISNKRVIVSDPERKGITIEYCGIRIRLEEQFEPMALKQCLEVLKEVVC
jgi:transposase-like protein